MMATSSETLDKVLVKKIGQTRRPLTTIDPDSPQHNNKDLRYDRLFKTYKFAIYSICLAGFLWQAVLICQQYFTYPTLTVVSVTRALPVTNFPQVAFCFEWMLESWNQSVEMFRQHIDPPPGTFTWGNATVRKEINRGIRSTPIMHSLYSPDIGKSMVITKFLQKRASCFSLKTRHPLNLSVKELFREPVAETIFVNVNLLRPYAGFSKFWSDPNVTALIVHIYAASYESDFEAPFLIPITRKANRNSRSVRFWMTYSQKVIRLLPPPFDTNCRDYRSDDHGNIFTSQHNCLQRCINDWTVDKHGLIFEDHVAEYDRYLKGRNRLSPIWYALKDDDMSLQYCTNLTKMERKLTIKTESTDEDGDEDEDGNDNDAVQQLRPTADDLKPIISIFPDIRKRISFCRKSCSRPDCTVENIIPYPIYFMRTGGKGFREVHLFIMSPKEPVVLVTSQAQLSLIDFVIYISSCLSFWFGFCPLAIARKYTFLESRFFHLSRNTSQKNDNDAARSEWQLVRTATIVTSMLNNNQPTLHIYTSVQSNSNPRANLNRLTKRKGQKRSKHLAQLFRSIVYMLATIGFTYQGTIVCSEYFNYKTITSVTVVGALPKTNFPQVALCMEWPYYRKSGSGDTSFQQHHYQHLPNGTYPWGSPIITSAKISRNVRSTISTDDPMRPIPGHKFMQLGYFTLRKSTCISIKTKYPLNLAPDELFRSPNTMTIDVTIKTKPSWSGLQKFFHNRKHNTIQIFVYMTAYDSNFDDPYLVPLTIKGHKANKVLTLVNTFSQNVMQKLPPPYDTNCRDYRKLEITSRHSCIRRCIDDWTVREHNLIFEDHAVDRYKYFEPKDPSKSLPWLKPLWFEFKDDNVTADYLFNEYKKEYEMEMKYRLQNTTKAKNRAEEHKLKAEYMKLVGQIFPALKNRMNSCEQMCKQPDCHIEYNTPIEIHYDQYGPKPLSIFHLGLHPPKEPAIIVTSKEKMNLIDCVVLLASCFSFWYGLCPLDLANLHQVFSRKSKFKLIVQHALPFTFAISKATKGKQGQRR